MRSIRVLPLFGLLLSCGQTADVRPPDGAGADRFITLPEIRLEETDSVFIGRPGGFAISPAGRVAVGDGMVQRVLLFDAAGRRTGIIGRRGSGPGEFQSTGLLTFLTDTTLVVSDIAQARLSLFSVKDSITFLRQIIVQGTPSVIQRKDPATVVFGLYDDTQPIPTMLAEWQVAEDSIRQFLPVPREMLATRVVRWSLPDAMVVPIGPDFLVAFTGVPYVVRYAGVTWLPLDTLWTPAIRRRGFPPDLDDRLAQNGTNLEASYLIFSVLQGIGVLSDGNLAVVHFDLTARGNKPFNESAWLSILSVRDRMACVDAPLPVIEDSFARITFRGDTLVMIDQRVEDSGEAATIVRRYVVNAEGCDWLPADGTLPTFRSP